MFNGFIQLAEAVPKVQQESPFIAALILIVIILVVGVGDMRTAQKEGKNKEEKEDEK